MTHAQRRAVAPRITLAEAAAVGLGLAFIAVALAAAVWALLVPPVLCLLALAVHRWGLAVTVIVLALAGVCLSAAVGRYVPAAMAVNQLALIGLAAIGAASLSRARALPVALKVPTGIFLALSAGWSFPSVQASTAYGVRGFLALILPILVALAVLGAARRARTGADVILGALIAAAAITIAIGLKQAILGLSGAEIAAARSGDSTYLVGQQIRLMGAFRTNQDLAVFLTFFAPAFLVLSVTAHGRRRWLFGSLSALLYLVAFLSLTRTALIASVPLGVVGLFVALKGDAALRAVKTTGICAIIAGLSAFVISRLDIDRVDDAIARVATIFALGEDTSFNARLNSTLPRAWSIFTAQPGGVGAGSAGPISQQFPTVAPRGVVTPDNGYLVIGIQVGAIGLLAFGLMLLALVWHLIRSESPLAVAAGVGTAAVMVAMLLAGYWSLGAPIALAAAFVGLGLGELTRAGPG